MGQVAIITGASRGLGRALARSLAHEGWSLVLDARAGAALDAVADEIATMVPTVALAGDVTSPAHRQGLVDAAAELGGLDLIINNASTLGRSPLPPVRELSAFLRRLYDVNVVAPFALIAAGLFLLECSTDPRIINVTSDAAVANYENWGGYGSSKAALDHLSATLAEEEPGLRVWSVDPGDLRTQMHQDAFPGEDISDRPEPETVCGPILALISSSLPSGRYLASDLVPVAS